jgi:DnaJ-class molecular chaperone
MSEIKIYDPKGKCEHCMGSGHRVEFVCKEGSLDATVLTSHCPYCNGTGKASKEDEQHPVS